jgi:HEAT repeat protein
MPVESRPLSKLIELVEIGQHPSAVQLTALSDLDADQVAYLNARWPSVPLAARRAVLSRVKLLADDNVELDFTQFAIASLADEDTEVRRLAAEALWESGDIATGHALSRAVLSDPDESVRAAAATRLVTFVALKQMGGFGASANSIIEALRTVALAPAESSDVRGRAIESLGALTEDWVSTLVTDAYYSEDQRLRLAAVRAMGLSAEDRWLEYLEEQTLSDDPEFRFEAVTALGDIASEDGLAAAAALFNDDDSEVTTAALFAIAEIGGDEALALLQSFDARGDVLLETAWTEALDILNSFGDQDLLRERIGLTSHEDE